MKTTFKTQGTLITLKSYDYPVPVFPGLHVLLHQKNYIVQQAILDLDKDELVAVVNRSPTDPTPTGKPA